MKLSIIILTWNSATHIKACLRSIFNHVVPGIPSCEIFVVDNGSQDNTTSIIKQFQEEFPGYIESILLLANHGTTYSRNLALKKATGDYVAIIDSDVILPRDAVAGLLEVLDSSPDIGLVVPRLTYKDGRFQKSTDAFPTLLTKLNRYFFLKRMECREDNTRPERRTVDYAISAFWLMKQSIVDEVGLLDENIFYAPEDVDYCLRIWKAGYKIVYVPSCVVIHDAQEISRGFRMNRAFLEHAKGLLYFFSKHRYWLRKPQI